jgi:hypothetical protein
MVLGGKGDGRRVDERWMRVDERGIGRECTYQERVVDV